MFTEFLKQILNSNFLMEPFVFSVSFNIYIGIYIDMLARPVEVICSTFRMVILETWLTNMGGSCFLSILVDLG